MVENLVFLTTRKAFLQCLLTKIFRRLLDFPKYLFPQTLAPAFFSNHAGTATTAHLIINAAGLDRLGIVSDVTGLVIQHGGNVGESVAARLGSSYFSLMMLVTVPAAARDALQQQVLAVPGLSAAVFAVDNASTIATATAAKPVIGCAYFMTVEFIFIRNCSTVFEFCLLLCVRACVVSPPIVVSSLVRLLSPVHKQQQHCCNENQQTKNERSVLYWCMSVCIHVRKNTTITNNNNNNVKQIRGNSP